MNIASSGVIWDVGVVYCPQPDVGNFNHRLCWAFTMKSLVEADGEKMQTARVWGMSSSSMW